MAASASAQTAPRVPLASLVAEALERNPEIAAARLRQEALRQRVPQEKSLPDPMASFGWNSSGNPLPGAGLGSAPTANIGGMISQAFPYRGKLALKGALAAREADADATQIDAARRSVEARVKQAYYRLAYTYAAGAVLTRSRELLETLCKVSEGRYAVGQAAQQDAIKAQTQLRILDIQVERVLQERATREGELNALLARPVATPVGQPEDLALTHFDASLEQLVATAAERAPMLQRDRIMIDRAQLGVDAARKEYSPDFVASGGYFNMGSMPPMFEVRFDVTLPLRRASRAAAVAEQLGVVSEAKQTYESSRFSLQARLQEDYQMASTSVRLATLYRDGVLPQARFALESSMASYQTGRVDFLSVVTNFGMLLEYEMAYFDELTSYHAAVSRLEDMIGAPLAH